MLALVTLWCVSLFVGVMFAGNFIANGDESGAILSIVVSAGVPALVTLVRSLIGAPKLGPKVLSANDAFARVLQALVAEKSATPSQHTSNEVAVFSFGGLGQLAMMIKHVPGDEEGLAKRLTAKIADVHAASIIEIALVGGGADAVQVLRSSTGGMKHRFFPYHLRDDGRVHKLRGTPMGSRFLKLLNGWATLPPALASSSSSSMSSLREAAAPPPLPRPPGPIVVPARNLALTIAVVLGLPIALGAGFIVKAKIGPDQFAFVAVFMALAWLIPGVVMFNRFRTRITLTDEGAHKEAPISKSIYARWTDVTRAQFTFERRPYEPGTIILTTPHGKIVVSHGKTNHAQATMFILGKVADHRIANDGAVPVTDFIQMQLRSR